MSAHHAVETTRVPASAQTLMQPLKPFQQAALQTFRHVQSRKATRCATVLPGANRPFPSFAQAHMLQPEEGPGDPVCIHPVVWTCMEAATQEMQA